MSYPIIDHYYYYGWFTQVWDWVSYQEDGKLVDPEDAYLRAENELIKLMNLYFFRPSHRIQIWEFELLLCCYINFWSYCLSRIWSDRVFWIRVQKFISTLLYRFASYRNHDFTKSWRTEWKRFDDLNFLTCVLVFLWILFSVKTWNGLDSSFKRKTVCLGSVSCVTIMTILKSRGDIFEITYYYNHPCTLKVINDIRVLSDSRSFKKRCIEMTKRWTFKRCRDLDQKYDFYCLLLGH